ncbi:MAG: hypothetical protein KOO63_13220 [Bacteroidales bacterium]|nr:hypothetical protein [Candidatus Latescibacterota bacterium]
MKNRVRKLRKIARYFEQKKLLSVVELQKASSRRNMEENILESLYLKKNEFFLESIPQEGERLNIEEMKRFRGGKDHFDRRITLQKSSVLTAIRDEHGRRESVVNDSITHKIWEKVVSSSESDLMKHLEVVRSRVADDLALVHAYQNKNR